MMRRLRQLYNAVATSIANRCNTYYVANNVKQFLANSFINFKENPWQL